MLLDAKNVSKAFGSFLAVSGATTLPWTNTRSLA